MYSELSKSRLRAKTWKVKEKSPYPQQEQDNKPQSGISSVLKGQNQDLKDMYIVCYFKIKIESQKLDQIMCVSWLVIIYKWKSRCQTQVRNLWCPTKPKSRFKEHGWSFNHQNQDSEPKFEKFVYQRTVTIFRAGLRCQILVRNIQCPAKHQLRLKWQIYSLHLQNQLFSQIQIIGLSNPTGHDFGSLQDSKLFWENQIWFKLKFDSWAF